MLQQTMEKPSTMTNGVDVTALSETLSLLNEKPTLGAFQFRASNRWVGGGLTGRPSKAFTAPARSIAGRRLSP